MQIATQIKLRLHRKVARILTICSQQQNVDLSAQAQLYEES